jgi:hypothetical protein
MHINPYRVEDNAELFAALMARYLNKAKTMVVADGVCVVDMVKDTRTISSSKRKESALHWKSQKSS